MFRYFTSIVLTVFIPIQLFIMGCDSIEPGADSFLVVEGFVEANRPLPRIKLTQAVSLNAALSEIPADSARLLINDALFTLILNDIPVEYTPSTTYPGTYEPKTSEIDTVPPNSRFEVDIEWNGRKARTEGIVPTAISIDSVHVKIPEAPVTAIIVDTLKLDTPEVGARRGYIYPIEVAIWWNTKGDETERDSLFWIETRLQPQIDFSSKVLDVFLLPEEVQPERKIKGNASSILSWTGVYAVPVSDSLSAVPDHVLKVQLLRGTDAYALFATSRNNPERREPISNVDGAIGIIAGISLASTEITFSNGEVHPPTTVSSP